MVISEMPSNIWSLERTFRLRVDRSETTVAEYLENLGVNWVFGFHNRADICIFKEDVGSLSIRKIMDEISRRLCRKHAIRLIGEPREFASVAYLFAIQDTTLAVAPGNRLKRLYFASEWLDPHIEDWYKRLDALCWIARPTPDRIKIAENLISKGIPLHIYSRDPWPFPQWKGYADDEIVTSRHYRYRLVCENSCKYGYHSEKLFNGIRSGCVTFYSGDSSLNLPHLTGAYLWLSTENLQNRQEHASTILKGIERVMFSTDWEMYSFRKFYDRIIDLATEVLKTAYR